MKKSKLEFETKVNRNGRVEFSLPVTLLGAEPGSDVTVSIVPGRISKILDAREVTNEEVDRIAALQYEDRQNVIRFLEAEGALAFTPNFLERGMELFR